MKANTRRILLMLLASTILAGLIGTPLRAQDGDDREDVGQPPTFDRPLIYAQQEPGRMRNQQLRKEMEQGGQRKHLEQLRLLKLLEVLDLSEEQQPKFMTAFTSMRKNLREMDDYKIAVIERLSQELKSSKPDDRKINGMVDSVIAIESNKRQTLRSFVDDMRATLTPVQVGRLIVFTERFEFELLERVREFRDRMRDDDKAPTGRGRGL